MILFTEWPIEIDIQILSYLDIRDVMVCMLLSKHNYHNFHNIILPDSYPNFYFTETRYYHRAIMYNKCNILKWLIKNNILLADHKMLCQYYKKFPELNSFLLFHQEYLDISLSLA